MMNLSLFDLHCDTANPLVQGVSLFENNANIDLVRASVYSAYAQCFAVFTTSFQKDPVGVFQRKKSAIEREVRQNSERIAFARSSLEIEENRKCGKMSAILTLEGTAGIGYDPAKLEECYRDGFRMVSLCWNEQNPLTGSCKTGGGLTDAGKAFTLEAARLGFLLDVSHLSDEGFWDLVNLGVCPIVATHSNSRAVCRHARNLTDEMFSAIVESGGVAGINFYADFVGTDPDLDSVFRHVEHFLALDADGEHIAMGGDLDGSDGFPQGFTGVESYPAVADHFRKRGLSEDLISRIFWKNALRLFDSNR